MLSSTLMLAFAILSYQVLEKGTPFSIVHFAEDESNFDFIIGIDLGVDKKK